MVGAKRVKREEKEQAAQRIPNEKGVQQRKGAFRFFMSFRLQSFFQKTVGVVSDAVVPTNNNDAVAVSFIVKDFAGLREVVATNVCAIYLTIPQRLWPTGERAQSLSRSEFCRNVRAYCNVNDTVVTTHHHHPEEHETKRKEHETPFTKGHNNKQLQLLD